MNARQLDSLIDFYTRRSQDERVTRYQREWAAETVDALNELKRLRQGVPVEGMVS